MAYKYNLYGLQVITDKHGRAKNMYLQELASFSQFQQVAGSRHSPGSAWTDPEFC